MSTQTPLSKDDPIMIAWSHYKITDSYSNNRKWALLEEHVDGSLWAAFLAGWGASRREVNEQRTALTGPASDPTDNTCPCKGVGNEKACNWNCPCGNKVMSGVCEKCRNTGYIQKPTNNTLEELK